MLGGPRPPACQAACSQRVKGGGIVAERGGALVIGALVNLDHPARTIHWGWFLISIANLVVIALMIAVFILALFLPFPGRRRR